jgi:hypothetical protein
MSNLRLDQRMNETWQVQQLQPLPQVTTINADKNVVLDRILKRFSPINLQEMDSVRLMNRVDTKYILPDGILTSVFHAMQSNYQVLMIKGRRLNHYRTLYFDTVDFQLFNLHVNGNAERYKVRSREYLDTKDAFLEVKYKTNKNRTIKQRLDVSNPLSNINDEAEVWLDAVYPSNSSLLEAKVLNTFTRVTFVNKDCCERVTVDMDIRFFNADHSSILNGIAIAEVKSDSHNNKSIFKSQMRTWHIQPDGFSKYCVGASMLYDQVKKNSLKSKLLWIEKISKGVISNERA